MHQEYTIKTEISVKNTLLKRQICRKNTLLKYVYSATHNRLISRRKVAFIGGYACFFIIIIWLIFNHFYFLLCLEILFCWAFPLRGRALRCNPYKPILIFIWDLLGTYCRDTVINLINLSIVYKIFTLQSLTHLILIKIL